MMTKKALPDDIDNFFKGESIFFQTPTPMNRSKIQQPAVSHDKPLPKMPNSPPQPIAPQPQATHAVDAVPQEESQHQVGMLDVVTSLRQAINLKAWQEIIENTETQNSALRLTSEERYAVEDVVNELRRKYGIKTSMNEIARLGLLLLIYDFKQHKKDSVIHEVKKA